MSDIQTFVVSYRRYEDSPCCTNLVHARHFANIDREFKDCAWYFPRVAKDYEVEAFRARGMPERWC